MISCAKMCSPEHHENNAILTGSAVPFHCRYRRLLERIPFFLALCLRPAVNWRPSGSRDMFVCGCSWSSWVEAVTRGWHPNSCNSFTSSGLAPGETRAREMWVRMVLLLLIQWGALREGNEQDGCWAEELPHYESHAVILGGRVTDFLFASGQLSGKIIIVCVCLFPA